MSKIVKVKDVKVFRLLRSSVIRVLSRLLISVRLVVVCEIRSSLRKSFSLEHVFVISYVSARRIIHGKRVFSLFFLYLLLEMHL